VANSPTPRKPAAAKRAPAKKTATTRSPRAPRAAKTPVNGNDVAPAEEVIRTESLRKVFASGLTGRERVVAVDGVDLSVRRGEIFGLLGPNGAGKTTTVGMLTTRVIPTDGRAWVAGVDVVAQPALAKQTIGVVPQTNTLDRSLNVAENLYFHGRYFGMPAKAAHAAVDRLLEQFRLSERKSATIDALSGGMAQRLSVARAIMHRPSILFLDEPTAGLDPQSRLALWSILGELHADGQTIMLTTHYMEEADQLCDRVAIMDHGKILALDSPAGLKRSLGADTDVKIATKDDLAKVAAHMQKLRGATDARATDDVVHVYMRGASGALPTILNHAEKGGFTVTDISVTEPTLETVFISLTGKDLRE